LEVERSIAKYLAPFDTFPASDTKVFVDGILEVGILDELAYNRIGGTELVFRSCVEAQGRRIEKARTEITVSTHFKGIDTLDSRLFQDAMGGTLSASDAFVRIDLPAELLFLGVPHEITGSAAHAQKADTPQCIFQKRSPG